MGCGASKSQEPVFKPLGEGQFQTRFFKHDWRKQKSGQPLRWFVSPGDASDAGLTVLVLFNRGGRDEPPGHQEFFLNGNLVRLPQSVANTLEAVYKYQGAIMGLTSGWPPWYWMDAICVDERDPHEVTRQQNIAQYIANSVTYTLDLTGPKARIYSGSMAYTAPVINFPDSMNLVAMGTALDNLDRVREHQAGRLVWAER